MMKRIDQFQPHGERKPRTRPTRLAHRTAGYMIESRVVKKPGLWGASAVHVYNDVYRSTHIYHWLIRLGLLQSARASSRFLRVRH